MSFQNISSSPCCSRRDPGCSVCISLPSTPASSARGLVDCIYSGRTRRGSKEGVSDLARRLGMDLRLEEVPVEQLDGDDEKEEEEEEEEEKEEEEKDVEETEGSVPAKKRHAFKTPVER